MKKTILLLALAIMTPLLTHAQEMYAEYNGYGLLKFYYDNLKSSREGTVYELQKDVSDFYPGYPPMPGWMFSDPEWMKEVAYVVIDPSFDKARPTSALYMFSNFVNLTKIEGMKYLHTEEVTNMYGMFSECNKLKKVDVSHFDTRNVTDMEGMFDHCFALEELDLSGFDVSKVTTMTQMFRGDEKLATLNVSGWDTQSVTDMMGMFSSCAGLTKLDVSSFDTRNVENMDRMFASCYRLTMLDLRSFDMSKVRSAQEMFNSCRDLATIYCNDDWNETSTLTAESSAKMFYLCDAPLTGGNGTKYDGSKTDITYARPDTDDSPGYFTIKASLTPDPAAGYAVYSEEDKTLTFYYDDLINEREGKVYTMKHVYSEEQGFYFPEWVTDASAVEYAVFDPSYAAARPTDISFWFGFMDNLKYVENMEFLNTSAVTNMTGLFGGCKRLCSIDVSHFDTSSVTYMTYMFAVCNDLCQLDLRSFDMSSVSSTTAMFNDCSSLRTIYCNDDWSTLGISEYEEMFTGCDRLIGKGDGNVCRYDSEATGLDAARPCTAGTPGYFTAKAEEKGNSADVNGDGSVNVADIGCIIDVMAASARRLQAED